MRPSLNAASRSVAARRVSMRAAWRTSASSSACVVADGRDRGRRAVAVGRAGQDGHRGARRDRHARDVDVLAREAGHREQLRAAPAQQLLPAAAGRSGAAASWSGRRRRASSPTARSWVGTWPASTRCQMSVTISVSVQRAGADEVGDEAVLRRGEHGLGVVDDRGDGGGEGLPVARRDHRAVPVPPRSVRGGHADHRADHGHRERAGEAVEEVEHAVVGGDVGEQTVDELGDAGPVPLDAARGEGRGDGAAQPQVPRAVLLLHGAEVGAVLVGHVGAGGVARRARREPRVGQHRAGFAVPGDRVHVQAGAVSVTTGAAACARR